MKYTALTLGPIIKSLMLARRTKELWAASYFFSWLMGQIIQQLNNNEAIILPYPEKNSTKTKSAGIFPDRLILQSENGLFNELNIAVNSALEEAIIQFNFKNININDLKSYINAYIIEFEFNKRKNKEHDNIVFQAYDYLASCELNSNYSPEDTDIFLRMLQHIGSSKIYKDIFQNNAQYPSIIEIATKGLTLINYFSSKSVENQKKYQDNLDFFQQNENTEDGEIWNEIDYFYKQEKNYVNYIVEKEAKEEAIEKCNLYGKLKTSHKYIAIVQADGDSISKIIQNIAKENDKKKIETFSKALSNFSIEAANEIEKYGGTPVYVGGDDLLFFAPIANAKSKSENKNEQINNHIFKLISQIDKLFETNILNNEEINFDGDKIPSMSYGISITYYKYPMHEALRSAQSLLFGRAKKDNNEQKNAVAFRVLKHSGQYFEAVLFKPFIDEFEKILNINNKLALHSIIYNIDAHKSMLKEIITDKARLIAFFDNFYNDKKTDEVKQLINDVINMLYLTYNKTNDFKQTINQVYAQLRLVKFLNADYHE